MGWESSDMVRFDLRRPPPPPPPFQGQTRIAKVKSAYDSLFIGPRDLTCETNL